MFVRAAKQAMIHRIGESQSPNLHNIESAKDMRTSGRNELPHNNGEPIVSATRPFGCWVRRIARTVRMRFFELRVRVPSLRPRRIAIQVFATVASPF